MFDKYKMPLVARELTATTLPCNVNFLLLQILRVVLIFRIFGSQLSAETSTLPKVIHSILMFSLFHLISRGVSFSYLSLPIRKPFVFRRLTLAPDAR